MTVTHLGIDLGKLASPGANQWGWPTAFHAQRLPAFTSSKLGMALV
jgi:hypothetical protein